jgi:hypothetical protein
VEFSDVISPPLSTIPFRRGRDIAQAFGTSVCERARIGSVHLGVEILHAFSHGCELFAKITSGGGSFRLRYEKEMSGAKWV